MGKLTPPGIIDYPVKFGPGDTRYVRAKAGRDGGAKILLPKRPIEPQPKPVVNTTIPNPDIMESVARIARTLVLKAAKPGDPEPYAFGRTQVRPLVIAADDSGEYLVVDLLWSVGPVQRVCNGIVPSWRRPSASSAGRWNCSRRTDSSSTRWAGCTSRKGSHARAAEELERAVALAGPDPAILEHLGDALRAAQRPSDAAAAYVRALQALDGGAEPERPDQRAAIERKRREVSAGAVRAGAR